MNEILMLLFAAIVCEAITQIVGRSELFNGFRNFFYGRTGTLSFINTLLSCKYCLSVWVAAVVVVIGSLLVDFEIGLLGRVIFLFLAAIAVHRLSNVFHLMVDCLQEYRTWRWTYTITPNNNKED